MTRAKRASTTNPKKPTQPKVQIGDYISVASSEEWFKDNLAESIYNDTFHRIVDFYVIHSPCKGSSYSPKSLENLGWRNPWISSRFREAFDEVCSFSDSKFFKFVDSINKLKEAWNISGFDWIPVNPDKEFAVFAYAGESNPRMDLLHHIRNSLAHGRFTKKTYNHQEYLFLEDVNRVQNLQGLYIHARICIKITTLIEWIDLFEKRSTKAIELSSLYSET